MYTANDSKLQELLDRAVALVEPVSEGNADVSLYVKCIQEMIPVVMNASKEDFLSLDINEQAKLTFRSDRALMSKTVTKEADQISLLSTLVTYVHSKRQGLPEHSRIYMDRVTALRRKIEGYYDNPVQKFCGS